MKVCSKCKEEKDKKDFYKDSSRKDGLANVCKVCAKLYHRKYYEKNKEKIGKCNKEYREANNNKYSQYSKKYYKENKEHLLNYHKDYRAKTKEKRSQYHKDYRERNREKLMARSREHYQVNKEGYIEKDNSAAKYLPYVHKLTSDEAPKLALDGVSLEVNCRYCGKYFKPTTKDVKNRIASLNGRHAGDSYLYCSVSCKKACPVYRKVKYPKGFKKASSREVDPFIRQLCFERDAWACQKCGNTQKDGQLHCHHIEGYTQNPRLGNDVENCITLCKACHNEVHKLPGCKYNELTCN